MGEKYTAEKYRETLIAIHGMNGGKRKEAFGENRCIFSVSEIIEKYNVYINATKTGEYWERKKDGEMVVVRYVEKNIVYVYLCDGGHTQCFSLKYFIDNHTKTEHQSLYLEAFLEEMKEMSE